MKWIFFVLPVFTLLAIASAASTEQVDPRWVLNEARRLAGEGSYQEALEKHIWFHKNALETEPALAGVRLSFALHDWVRLAEKYPPAKEALQKIRDKQEQALEQGSGKYHDFVDVDAINDYLQTKTRTITLFKHLDRHDADLARRVYGVISDDLVSAGEHALARKYLGSPKVALAEILEKYQQLLQMAKVNPQLDTRQYHAYRESSFRRSVATVVEILVATGAEDEARQVFDEALEVTSKKEELRQTIREAVERGREALVK